MTVTVRQVSPDEWRDWRLMRGRSLVEDAGAFSASTTMWSGANDTEERWRARLDEGPCFIAYEGECPVGMVAGTAGEDGAHQLISMWVAPASRRQGVGAQLIQAVLDWNGDHRISLRVIDGNTAATTAYARHGFVMLDGDADSEGCRTMVRNRTGESDG